MCTAANLGPQRVTATFPIHRLTSNELVIIFRLLRDISDKEYLSSYWHAGTNVDHKWNWVVVTHICRYWRITAVEYAPLWSNLTQRICANSQMLTTFIERSKNADLEVTSSLRDGTETVNEKEPMIEILQLIGRIRYLSLYIPLDVDESTRRQIQDLLICPAPRLEDLDLHGNPYRSGVSAIDLPQRSPTLKRLSLVAFAVSRDLSIHAVTSLVQLKLEKVKGLTPLGFLSLLQSNPDLEILSIEQVLWEISADISLQSIEGVVVSLPKLTHLTSNFHGRYDARGLVGYDEILKCLDIACNANWKCSFTAPEKQTLLDMQFHQHLCSPRRSLTCEAITMHIFDDGFRIESTNFFSAAGKMGHEPDTSSPISPRDEFTSTLRFDWPSPESLVENLFETNGIGPLFDASFWKDAKSLQLELVSYRPRHPGEPLRIEEESWISFLRKFISIRSIQVRDDVHYYRNMETFLASLAIRNREGPTVQKDGLICPNLEHLSLKFPRIQGYTEVPDSFMQTLKNALQTRKQMGLGLKSLTVMVPYGITNLMKSDLCLLSESVDRIHRLRSSDTRNDTCTVQFDSDFEPLSDSDFD